MAEIVLDHVVKRYPDGALAVDDFNLEIADGEFIILVGPSGCGKSTTLNMVAGLEDITTGDLKIDGKVVNDKAPKDRDIAMVFQSYALYPHMTVGDNMAFPLVLAGVDKGTIKSKVDEAAEMLELTQHLDRKPANLSGGQRQRVAMGRAIVRSPKAFLMDEPLSNLDAKLRVQMRTQVSRIQKTLGTTTLYVTHDQTEAMTLGDRVVVHARRHRAAGRLADRALPAPTNLFVAGFIGSPSMNFLRRDDRGRQPQQRPGQDPDARPGPAVRSSARRARGHHRHPAGALRGRRPGRRRPRRHRHRADRPRGVHGLRRLRLLHRARRGALRRPRRPGQGHGSGHARRGHAGERPAGRRCQRPGRAAGDAVDRHREDGGLRCRDRCEPDAGESSGAHAAPDQADRGRGRFTVVSAGGPSRRSSSSRHGSTRARGSAGSARQRCAGRRRPGLVAVRVRRPRRSSRAPGVYSSSYQRLAIVGLSK